MLKDVKRNELIQRCMKQIGETKADLRPKAFIVRKSPKQSEAKGTEGCTEKRI